MSMKDRHLERKNEVAGRCRCRNSSAHGRLGGVVSLCMVLAFGLTTARADEEAQGLRLATGSTRHSIPLAPSAAKAMNGRVRAISLHDDTLAVLLAPVREKRASLVQISLTTGEMVRQFDLAVAGDDNVYLKVTEDAVWTLCRNTGRLVRCDFSGELKQESTVLPENYTSVNGQYFDGAHWWIFATGRERHGWLQSRNRYGLWRFDPNSGEQTPEFEVPQFGRFILNVVGLSFAAENLAQVVVEEMLEGKRNVVVYSRQLFQEDGSVRLSQNRATSDGYRSKWLPDYNARVLDMRGTRHADKWLYQVRDLPDGRQSGLLVRLGNFHRPREGMLIVEDSDVAGKTLIDCDEKRVVWMVPNEDAVHWINYTKSHWQAPVKAPPEPWPTKERPIVLRRGEGLVFGGPDGSERITVEWPRGTFNYLACPCGQWAAAVVTGRRDTPLQQIILYGPDGKEVRRTDLPREWVDDRRAFGKITASRIAIARSGDVVVSMESLQVKHHKAHGVGDAETYFFGVDGNLKALGIPTVARDMWSFPKNDGFLVLTDEGDYNWDVYRLDASGELLWKRRVHVSTGAVPDIWPAHDDPNVDLRIRGDGKQFNYTRNGELVE